MMLHYYSEIAVMEMDETFTKSTILLIVILS